MNPSKETTLIQNVLENGYVFSNIKRHDSAFYVNSDQKILIGPFNGGGKSALTINQNSEVNVRTLDVDGTLSAEKIVSRNHMIF